MRWVIEIHLLPTVHNFVLAYGNFPGCSRAKLRDEIPAPRPPLKSELPHCVQSFRPCDQDNQTLESGIGQFLCKQCTNRWPDPPHGSRGDKILILQVNEALSLTNCVLQKVINSVIPF